GLEVTTVAVDHEVAPAGRDDVEPHAPRHRRDGATPRLAHVRRAVEDAADRDVAQCVGDGGHGPYVDGHATILTGRAPNRHGSGRSAHDGGRIAMETPGVRLDGGRMTTTTTPATTSA